MDAKRAVAKAKAELSEIFSDDIALPPTLEEIWFDVTNSEWCVTLGLTRKEPGSPYNNPLSIKPKIDYKVVRISETTATVTSIRNRDLTAA